MILGIMCYVLEPVKVALIITKWKYYVEWIDDKVQIGSME